MRKWTLLALMVLMAIAVGCTSSVHPAIDEKGPTADTGVLPKNTSTTGGDAAGSLNLPKGESHEGGAEGH